MLNFFKSSVSISMIAWPCWTASVRSFQLSLRVVLFCLSQARTPAWTSEGGRGSFPPLDFEIRHFPITFLEKRLRFVSFERERWNFTTFGPSTWKIFLAISEKNPTVAPLLEKGCPSPLEKIAPTPIDDWTHYFLNSCNAWGRECFVQRVW